MFEGGSNELKLKQSSSRELRAYCVRSLSNTIDFQNEAETQTCDITLDSYHRIVCTTQGDVALCHDADKLIPFMGTRYSDSLFRAALSIHVSKHLPPPAVSLCLRRSVQTPGGKYTPQFLNY